jgi:Zn-dependent M28 family amino/carboxypeptidase
MSLRGRGCRDAAGRTSSRPRFTFPARCAAVFATLLFTAMPAAAQDRAGIRESAIRAHLAFLADDMLEGRAPGSRGGTIAARYIASQLSAAGVQRVDGSQYQQVQLLGWRARPESVAVRFDARGRSATLAWNDDVVVWLRPGMATADISAELVFAGYGVTAPEYDWDDFKGRDVTGRIMVVLAGDPPTPPSQPLVFDGGAMSWYGRWTYKIEEAARRGAAGVIIVHTEDGAGYPWSVVETSFTGEQLALPQDPRRPALPTASGWVTFAAAQRALQTGGHDLNELYVRAARRDFQPVFTGITARMAATGATRAFETPNVVGLVPGSHPERRAETVVYTAHYDGLGIGTPVDGDSIYNGAYDNAGGVAILLEVARAFAARATPPERSVLFIFTTAEEAGLLGASWYVRHPLRPLVGTVAALNIDGANLWGETDDAAAVGLERSTLGLVFDERAIALGLRPAGERAPDRGFFFRSDHFPFARAGVPALFLDHGIEFRNRPPGWGIAMLTEFEVQRYHQPGDGYDRAFNLGGAVQQARLAFAVGAAVADTPTRPRWYPGGAPVR